MTNESNSRHTRRRRIVAIAAAAALTAGASVAMVTSAQAAPAAAVHHTSSPKPTIVLIHGAFADASGFDAEITKLSALGYPVYAPSNPLRGLTSDSDYVRSFLKTISGPIVLVGHSYGGAVITNAARGVPNVKALVYLDAFIPKEGDSAATAVPSKYTGSLLGNATLTARPYTTASGATDADLYITPKDFRKVFAGDVSPARAKLEALTQRPLANAAFTEKSGDPAWKTIPSWDLIGTQDKAIDPAGQEFMAKQAGAHISHVKSAHDVMISHPKAVVDEILKAVHATR
jgi:pimeloyl-ACP methyl ester carboxylesterase